MDNKKLSLREKDDDLLEKICEVMNAQGRTDLMRKYKVDTQSKLSGHSEAYHFKYYKNKQLSGLQQDVLDGLLKKRTKRGIEVVDRLPTENATRLEMAKFIFEHCCPVNFCFQNNVG